MSTATSSIGLKELYRFLAPGSVFLAILIITIPILNSDTILDVGTKVALAFAFGLAIYAFNISRRAIRIPYNRELILLYQSHLEKEVNLLYDEMSKVCSLPQSYLKEDERYAAYTYFLNNHVDRSRSEKIHFDTSFYYMFNDVSFIFLLFGIFGIFFWALVSPVECFNICLSRLDMPIDLTQIDKTAKISSYVLSYPTSDFRFPIMALISFVSYRIALVASTKTLHKIINQQIILIRQEFGKYCYVMLRARNMREYGENLEPTHPEDQIHDLLVEMSKDELGKIVLDHGELPDLGKGKIVQRKDIRTDQEITVFPVEVKANRPILSVGFPGGYSGRYKESIETRLNLFLGQFNETYRASLDVSIRDGEEDGLYYFISPEKAKSQGIITSSARIYTLAEKYNLQILIRGRRVVGPNPALATALEKLLDRKQYKNILDLFTGTGLVSSIALDRGLSTTAMDLQEPPQIRKLKSSNQEKYRFYLMDIFSDPLLLQVKKSKYDLVVADPEYEYSVDFVRKIVSEIKNSCDAILLVHGYVEDVQWNEKVRQLLQQTGFQTEIADEDGHAITYAFR